MMNAEKFAIDLAFFLTSFQLLTCNYRASVLKENKIQYDLRGIPVWECGVINQEHSIDLC